MKSITTLILIFSTSFIFSQQGAVDASTGSSRLGVLENMTMFGGGATVYNKKNDIVGNIHVFDQWRNVGIIKIDSKNYRLGNINLNMKTDNFESQVGKDSIFILDASNVEHVFVNNRKFKSFFFSKKGDRKNFEVIYDGEDFKLLKGYDVGIKYGKPDPLMVKKTVDTYFSTKTYYVKTGDYIEEVGLKKKEILPLFKEKSKMVGAFVKEQKLSYKKDKDLKKIFSYYTSLSE